MKRLLTIIILLASVLHLAAQTTSSPTERLRRYVKNMESFNKYFPQEKVYLHLDNTAYFRGETIWIKAYVVRDDRSTLTDISKVLYVELLSPTGELMDTKKLHLEDGQADTAFKLDSLFYSGFYEVRAYTRYMLNWDERGIFSRVIPIFSAPKREGDYSKPKIDDIAQEGRMPSRRALPEGEEDRDRLNVRFFPEGGRMVRGLRSRVAFEVTDKDGAFVDAEGTLDIINAQKKDTTLMAVKTMRDGRGCFFYTPTEDFALLSLKDRKGKRRRFLLPEADRQGCVMTVEDNGSDHIDIKVARTDSADTSLAFVLMKNGNVEAFEPIDMTSTTTAERSLNRSEMSDGVNQVAIINSRGEVVADRLVFIFPHYSTDTIGMAITQSALSPCKKVTIMAKTRPNARFSVAVRDWAGDVNGANTDVATWTLLASDLKGYIRNPEYYIEKDDKEHRKATDLLMLVQGWRRYDMAQMAGKKPFEKKQPIEDGLYLFGRLKQAKKKYPVDNVSLKVNLFNREGLSLSGAATTEKDGRYAFRLPDCEGDWTLLMNTKKGDKDAKYYVTIDRNFSPRPAELSYYDIQRIPVREPRQRLRETEDYGVIKAENLLREVKVRGKRRYKSARDSWEREQRGAFSAYVRYDCVKEADAIADRGEEIPDLFSWFARRNAFLGGEDDGKYSGESGTVAEKGYMESLMNIYTSNDVEDMDKHSDVTYKNRPIVWIWNNQFLQISGMNNYLTKMSAHSTVYDKATGIPPTWLDDFKSIYIAEGNIWTHYISFPDLSTYHPITIFLYSPYRYYVRQKGIRRTVYEGYSPKMEFYSPDYSTMAPMPDYRRTLYWNPNVKADKDGVARIEFYNNSTCRQLIISAEGITQDGTVLIYRQQ